MNNLVENETLIIDRFSQIIDELKEENDWLTPEQYFEWLKKEQPDYYNSLPMHFHKYVKPIDTECEVEIAGDKGEKWYITTRVYFYDTLFHKLFVEAKHNECYRNE